MVCQLQYNKDFVSCLNVELPFHLLRLLSDKDVLHVQFLT